MGHALLASSFTSIDFLSSSEQIGADKDEFLHQIRMFKAEEHPTRRLSPVEKLSRTIFSAQRTSIASRRSNERHASPADPLRGPPSARFVDSCSSLADRQ